MYFPKSEGNSLCIFWTHISGCLWRIVHQLEEEKVDELCSKASQKYANLDDKNELCSKTFPSEEIVAGMETLCTRKNRRRMHFLLKERSIWIFFFGNYGLSPHNHHFGKGWVKKSFCTNVQIANFGIWLWRHLWWGIALFQHFFSSFGISEKEFSYESAANPPAADCRISDGAIFGASRPNRPISDAIGGDLSKTWGEISKARGAHRAPATIVTLVSGYKWHIFRIF